MKSKFKTLCDIVAYVKNESENPVDELLNMGFSAAQLVYEFGFDKKDVVKSETYQMSDENIEEEIYPFLLDNFSNLDAAIISHFEISPDALMYFKSNPMYEEMKKAYKYAKDEIDTDILNDLFSNFEGRFPKGLRDTLKREHFSIEKVPFNEISEKLQEIYTLQTTILYLKIAEDTREFENDEIRIVMERTPQGDLYSLMYKNN
ncbi:MAG: hypothetical protein IJ341_02600 [Bacteroidales bacterium]|nr:hypothetical protein [Bacteroidales bacterium]